MIVHLLKLVLGTVLWNMGTFIGKENFVRKIKEFKGSLRTWTAAGNRHYNQNLLKPALKNLLKMWASKDKFPVRRIFIAICKRNIECKNGNQPVYCPFK